MKAKLMAMLLAAVMVLSACGGSGNSNKPADDTKNDTPATTPAEPSTPSTPATPGEPAEFNGKLQGPFIMTTCGQSTGSVMVHMVATQAGMTSVDDHALEAKTLEVGDAKTLVITTGTSGKGMGAAGTDVDAEIERCTALAEEAKSQGMTIVCAHVEGMSRRTDSADQASIDAILPLADVIVCVKDSDSDGLFSNYAESNNVPIIIVEDTLSLGEYME